jgi:hypothetical protein
MSMVGFPLLLIPLAICNIVVFLMPGTSFATPPLFTVPLMSGGGWAVTLSDILVTLGILMLLLEVIKGARPGAKYLTDHLLSLLVFGGAAAEFVLLPQFATSTYFLLTALALADFLSGVALRTRRPRAASMVTASASARSSSAAHATTAKAAPLPPAEPRFDPVPAPSVPSAEPVIEAAPSPRVEPSVAHSEAVDEQPVQEPAQKTSEESAHEAAQIPSPETVEESDQESVRQAVHESSPEIQSPGIQPGHGVHPTPDKPQR